MPLSLPTTLILLLTTCLILFTTRLILILPRTRAAHPVSPRQRRAHQPPTHLLIILGSGGHTAEMLTMLANLDTTAYQHRTYVISAGDPISATKAVAFETALRAEISTQLARDFVRPSKAAADLANAHYGSFRIEMVPRARRVHQSVVTAPVSCVVCFVAVLRVLLGSSSGSSNTCTAVAAPDLILANGPATSAIVVFASLALRFFGVQGHVDTRIVYVESFARVNTLSLSARCVAWAVDRLLVQWPELDGKAGGKAEYVGLLALANLPER